MPFIFHSARQSIFDKKISQPTKEQTQKKLEIQNKIAKDPNFFKIDVEISREHPFRKLNKNVSQKYEDQPIEKRKTPTNKNIMEFLMKQNKNKIIQYETKKNKLKNETKITAKQLQGQAIKKTLPQVNINNLKKVHTQYINDQAKFKYKQKLQQQSTQFQNITYINDTPGPGSYNLKYPSSKQKAAIFYAQKPTLPLRPNKNIHQLIGQMTRKQQQNEIQFTCSYKNQMSYVFKTKSLNNQSMRKNGQLLSKLFFKKDKPQISDLQTACESRHVQRSKIIDNELQINHQRSPSPCSYNPSKDFNKSFNKNKVFISGADRTDNSLTKKNIILNQQLNTSLFNQNQIKNSIPQNINKQELLMPKYPFASTVPRQLHFDTQKLCRQQFNYSPKNNFSDIIDQKTNHLSKFKFGSTLQRFQDLKRDQIDPYKYCQAKSKYLNNGCKNIASLKYTENRQLFSPVDINVSPNRYNLINNTILENTQQILIKNQTKQKFKDQKMLNSQKKKALEQPIQRNKNKIKTIHNYPKSYQNINPDKYKEYLIEVKNKQKQNISFGQDIKTKLKRGIQPKQSLDICYDIQPSWKIGSFNKNYGYQIFLG